MTEELQRVLKELHSITNKFALTGQGVAGDLLHGYTVDIQNAGGAFGGGGTPPCLCPGDFRISYTAQISAERPVCGLTVEGTLSGTNECVAIPGVAWGSFFSNDYVALTPITTCDFGVILASSSSYFNVSVTGSFGPNQISIAFDAGLICDNSGFTCGFTPGASSAFPVSDPSNPAGTYEDEWTIDEGSNGVITVHLTVTIELEC